MADTSALLDLFIGWDVPTHPAFHSGGVLSHPVRYQLYWAEVGEDGQIPGLAAAVTQ